MVDLLRSEIMLGLRLGLGLGPGSRCPGSKWPEFIFTRSNAVLHFTQLSGQSASCIHQQGSHRPLTSPPVCNFIYKSLFTENSVATQKQNSTSINTNKVQNTTIKSITSSFFTKLNYLLHLITKLAKAHSLWNVSHCKLILPFCTALFHHKMW